MPCSSSVAALWARAAAGASSAHTVRAVRIRCTTDLLPSVRYGWCAGLPPGGMTTVKSALVSALPPNTSHALQRPVRSQVRACQWYCVPLVSPPACTDAAVPLPLAETKSLTWVGELLDEMPRGSPTQVRAFLSGMRR